MDRFWRHARNTRRMNDVRNESICRHFINGSCSFGSRCHYRHEWPVLPSTQVCRYFQKGGCWFGPCCRYLHVLQPEVPAGRRNSVPTISSSVVNSPSNRRGSVPAPLQAEGMFRQEIRRLESVINYSNRHSAGCPGTDIAETQTQDPGSNLVASVESVQQSDLIQACAHDRQNKQEALTSKTTDDGDGDGGACAGAAAAASAAAVEDSSTHLSARDSEAYSRSKNVTCGICMETVYEKSDARSHMFGLLPNCNHSYCLPCIMTWRKTRDLGPDTVKSCPQCRVRSPFYVPHKYWVEGQEKQSVITAFKDKFSKKSCSYYSRHGYCPFKTECLYRHDKGSRHRTFQYPIDDEEDYEDVDLLNFFIAMTLISGDDSEDDDDDDFSYFLAEYGY